MRSTTGCGRSSGGCAGAGLLQFQHGICLPTICECGGIEGQVAVDAPAVVRPGIRDEDVGHPTADMRGRGHYATYGNVTLENDTAGAWRGSIDTGGLAVIARCVQSGAVTGGAESAGTQMLFPPLSSATRDLVRVAFA